LILASFNVQAGFQSFVNFKKVQDVIAFLAIFIAFFAFFIAENGEFKAKYS
jgi:hypothetical protein